MRRSRYSLYCSMFAVLATGCTSAQVRLHTPALDYSYSVPDTESAVEKVKAEPDTLAALELGVDGYISTALSRSPVMRSAYAAWKTRKLQISGAATLPEPHLNFSAFLSSIETREGPQLGRLGLRQGLPWPGTLKSREEAARQHANAAALSVEVEAHKLRAQVESAYWSLWRLRAGKEIHEEHLLVLESLAESVRARMATGAATLSDLQQVELTQIRVADSIAGQRETELTLEARLRALMGFQAIFKVPTNQAPDVKTLQDLNHETLLRRAREHPSLRRSQAHQAQARANIEVERRNRLPTFSIGLEWTMVGEHVMDGEKHGGKDALGIGAGLKLPLWQDVYQDAIHSAESELRTRELEERAIRDQITGKLLTEIALLRDAFRRAKTYRESLVPRAADAYQSVLGAYTVGRGSIAQILLAQRDLLEFKVQEQEACADLEIARARLRETLGESLPELEPRGEQDVR